MQSTEDAQRFFLAPLYSNLVDCIYHNDSPWKLHATKLTSRRQSLAFIYLREVTMSWTGLSSSVSSLLVEFSPSALSMKTAKNLKIWLPRPLWVMMGLLETSLFLALRSAHV